MLCVLYMFLLIFTVNHREQIHLFHSICTSDINTGFIQNLFSVSAIDHIKTTMSRDNTYVLYFVVEIWFEIVLCFSPPARTINWDTGRTPSISGKVAVTQYSLQGKVCADAWSDNAANVVCRNHGYNGGVAITYQEHTASVDWILTLNCTGDEMSLSECTMNEDINLPCSSTREIGVLCYNAGQYKGKHIQSLSMVFYSWILSKHHLESLEYVIMKFINSKKMKAKTWRENTIRFY